MCVLLLCDLNLWQVNSVVLLLSHGQSIVRYIQLSEFIYCPSFSHTGKVRRPSQLIALGQIQVTVLLLFDLHCEQH